MEARGSRPSIERHACNTTREIPICLSIYLYLEEDEEEEEKKSSVVNDDDAIEMERRIVSRGGCWVTPMTNHAIGHLSTPATSLSLSPSLSPIFTRYSLVSLKEERGGRERDRVAVDAMTKGSNGGKGYRLPRRR